MPLRTVAPLDRGWLYEPGADAPGADAPGADAPGPDAPGAASPGPAPLLRGQEPVTLPHTTVVLPADGFDDRAYQSTSTYRRRLRLTPAASGSRVVVRFEGVMTAATVSCNGTRLLEHLGGFVPFSVELTDVLRFDGDDELTVEVDSTERPDVPPFGGHIDYQAFGGIYRSAVLSLLPTTHVADVFARPVDVLTAERRVDVSCALDTTAAGGAPEAALQLEAELLDGERVLATARADVAPGAWADGRATATVVLRDLGEVRLWDVEDPALHRVRVRLLADGRAVDETEVRTGLREARFTAEGFFLNGRRTVLRGLNRHQTYPHVGAAMPARMQRRDAEVLRRELKCNAVRTSHYPQDPAFLDACDELGLLVFEEMPGWQHIGDEAWKELACRDVAAMVERDRNHPCIVLWGVRVNESFDDHDFYTRTNEIAHRLDASRQTSGVRYFPESELLEDVFSLNDFQTGGLIRAPQHPCHLVSEYAGHMLPTKRFDNVERVQEHAVLHLTVMDALHSDPRIAGGFGWCAFDYATHAEFGSGNRICYHGVCDGFRVAKAAASAYRSQCDPAEEVVLEPAFAWAAGDHSAYGGAGIGLVLSNCDRVVAHVGPDLVAEMLPDRAGYPNLPHPPFLFGHASGIAPWRRTWGDLRLEGYLGEELVAVRTLSGRGVDADLLVTVDHDALVADGADTTRLLARVTDEHGAVRPFASAALRIEVEGPLTLIGDAPAALVGGVAGAWLRAGHEAGSAVVRVSHPHLGTRSARVELVPAEEEPW